MDGLKPSISIVMIDSRSYMDRAPGHDLRYSLCADMTLHPGINLHAGRLWWLLNYVKSLIWVIYYKGFRLSPKMHSKTVSFSLYYRAACQYFLNEVQENGGSQWHHTPWCQRKRGREWGPQTGADKAGKGIPCIQQAMVPGTFPNILKHIYKDPIF